jgi:hypothetical protein
MTMKFRRKLAPITDFPDISEIVHFSFVFLCTPKNAKNAKTKEIIKYTKQFLLNIQWIKFVTYHRSLLNFQIFLIWGSDHKNMHFSKTFLKIIFFNKMFFFQKFQRVYKPKFFPQSQILKN